MKHINELNKEWEPTGCDFLGRFEYVRIDKKFCKIHYTAQDGKAYIWYRRTTWALEE